MALRSSFLSARWAGALFMICWVMPITPLKFAHLNFVFFYTPSRWETEQWLLVICMQESRSCFPFSSKKRERNIFSLVLNLTFWNVSKISPKAREILDHRLLWPRQASKIWALSFLSCKYLRRWHSSIPGTLGFFVFFFFNIIWAVTFWPSQGDKKRCPLR